MADEAGEKTEAPTPRRREEAREKGQVARSNDLSSALLLLGGLLSLRLLAPRMTASIMKSFQDNLSVTEPSVFLSADVGKLAYSSGLSILLAIGPLLFALFFIAVAANLLQVGFLFTTKPLEPKLDKLNPINGLTRMFGSRTLVQFGMNLLKLSLVVAVAYLSIRGRMGQIMLSSVVDGWQQVVVMLTVLYEVGLQLAMVLLVVAMLDYAWQRYKTKREMRMTKQEVKEELRRMEGDPLLKQRRRKMQFAAAMQQIRSAVPTADVVVTNPTEFAVAIKYDVAEMAAPKVVAKGADYLARKIREIAVLHGIPIVERKPLAQALYKTVEVGHEVPEKFYQTIAEILAYVYKLSGKSKGFNVASSAA